MNSRLSVQTRQVWRQLATLLFVLAAAGCAHDRTAPASLGSPHGAAQPAPVVATPDLSPDARLDLAEHLLQKGDAERARRTLACLDEEPTAKRQGSWQK
jgi:hypothetical protein